MDHRTNRLAGAPVGIRRPVFTICPLPSAAVTRVRTVVRFGHVRCSRQERPSRLNTLTILLYGAGAFALVLGILHLTFPHRFGFLAALPAEGPPVPPYRLLFYRYEMK